jgi:hypothetical protein
LVTFGANVRFILAGFYRENKINQPFYFEP